MEESQMSRSTKPFIHSTITQKQLKMVPLRFLSGSSEEGYPTKKTWAFIPSMSACAQALLLFLSSPAPSLCTSTLLSPSLSFIMQNVSSSCLLWVSQCPCICLALLIFLPFAIPRLAAHSLLPWAPTPSSICLSICVSPCALQAQLPGAEVFLNSGHLC